MAGNSNSGKRAGGKDFTPRVRSIVDQVLAKLEKSGDARMLLEAQFRDDFAGTLRALASYAPKQIEVSLDTTLTLEEYVSQKLGHTIDNEDIKTISH